MIEFRLARYQDVERIHELFSRAIETRTVFSEEVRREALATNTPQHLQARTLMDPPTLLVGEIDGVIRGMATLSVDSGVMYVPWVCVDPEMRDRRIGPAIWQAVLREGRRRGCHKVWGVSLSRNRSVSRHITRFGGRVVGVMKEHWFREDYDIWEVPLGVLPAKQLEAEKELAP